MLSKEQDVENQSKEVFQLLERKLPIQFDSVTIDRLKYGPKPHDKLIVTVWGYSPDHREITRRQ